MTQTLVPPFTDETERVKVQAAEDDWSSRDPDRVALAYKPDSEWRNRDCFLVGREEIRAFLTAKWIKERDCVFKKELWVFTGNHIAARFEDELRDQDNQWWRSHGNENCEFETDGLMQKRFASINDVPIKETERRLQRIVCLANKRGPIRWIIRALIFPRIHVSKPTPKRPSPSKV